MNFINTTNHPALAFEGIDQLGQSFHVVVMRQTYTWNEQGLLILAEEQDPLRLEDQLVDTKDLMSGVVEESDLAHYKPKCDVIIKGHAYAPKHKLNQDSFTASIKLQSPDYMVLGEPVAATKYAFVDQSTKKPPKDQYQAGQVLIDKTLTILSPRYLLNDSITGNSHYKLHIEPMPSKVSMNPSSSFGGYSLIEDNHKALKYIDKNELIPEDQRSAIKLNPHHGVIAYLQEDSFNPAGTGYCSPIYYKYVQPPRITLSQVHHPDLLISESLVNQVAKDKLDRDTHNQLVAGFGVRAKSHPERAKLVGQVDEDFIESGDAYPKGFDFAMWNSAYADQQTEFLTGNEWLTLTNLCKPDTTAATITRSGDTELKLYLPEVLAYMTVGSADPQLMVTELPMHLDTVIVSPDEQKVNLVWRSMIIGDYQPKLAVLAVLDKDKQRKLIEQYYTKTADIVRPYEIG
ncbi:DUF2169 domain-containing protein [Psychrobacter celer]|uniref:DUF2169 domain-containing protein n=1 Tax=Psychrobacter celer TaxID=306572 RepID=UPI003FD29F9B